MEQQMGNIIFRWSCWFIKIVQFSKYHPMLHPLNLLWKIAVFGMWWCSFMKTTRNSWSFAECFVAEFRLVLSSHLCHLQFSLLCTEVKSSTAKPPFYTSWIFKGERHYVICLLVLKNPKRRRRRLQCKGAFVMGLCSGVVLRLARKLASCACCRHSARLLGAMWRFIFHTGLV